ncbi:uncharacterized protein PV09_04139 [Verruconis gallopava]|uniref:Uncharacterized protein n=1 Tax=Verruconis gallopava TaxID=253628 RepID=A0A0D1YWD3_9PEZI|nr:uncharacterized protein PV09_04139 [Verruconis gallopava]KIW04977.1 hypothetical protein PV09_04139 [Verruconis gallopava]
MILTPRHSDLHATGDSSHRVETAKGTTKHRKTKFGSRVCTRLTFSSKRRTTIFRPRGSLIAQPRGMLRSFSRRREEGNCQKSSQSVVQSVLFCSHAARPSSVCPIRHPTLV